MTGKDGDGDKGKDKTKAFKSDQSIRSTVFSTGGKDRKISKFSKLLNIGGTAYKRSLAPIVSSTTAALSVTSAPLVSAVAAKKAVHSIKEFSLEQEKKEMITRKLELENLDTAFLLYSHELKKQKLLKGAINIGSTELEVDRNAKRQPIDPSDYAKLPLDDEKLNILIDKDLAALNHNKKLNNASLIVNLIALDFASLSESAVKAASQQMNLDGTLNMLSFSADAASKTSSVAMNIGTRTMQMSDLKKLPQKTQDLLKDQAQSVLMVNRITQELQAGEIKPEKLDAEYLFKKARQTRIENNAILEVMKVSKEQNLSSPEQVNKAFQKAKQAAEKKEPPFEHYEYVNFFAKQLARRDLVRDLESPDTMEASNLLKAEVKARAYQAEKEQIVENNKTVMTNLSSSRDDSKLQNKTSFAYLEIDLAKIKDKIKTHIPETMPLEMAAKEEAKKTTHIQRESERRNVNTNGQSQDRGVKSQDRGVR